MAAAFTGGMFLKGKSGWCSTICPLLPGPAHLRPDAARAGRQRPLPAVRRLRQELLRLQPARRLPGRPQRRRQLLERLPALLRRRVPGPRARRSSRSRTARTSRSSAGWRSTWPSSIAVFAHAQRVREDAARTRSRRLFGAIAFSIFYWYVARERSAARAARLGGRAPPRSRSPPPGSCARSARRSRSWSARAPRRPRRPRGRDRRRRAPRSPAPAASARSRRRAGGHLPPRQQARRAQARA